MLQTLLQKHNSLQKRHITQLQHQNSKEISAMEKTKFGNIITANAKSPLIDSIQIAATKRNTNI